MDDEKKHRFKIDPITKEEFKAEKEKLYAINSKVPKKVFIILNNKVMEYKIRKWKKTQKKMRKAA